MEEQEKFFTPEGVSNTKINPPSVEKKESTKIDNDLLKEVNQKLDLLLQAQNLSL